MLPALIKEAGFNGKKIRTNLRDSRRENYAKYFMKLGNVFSSEACFLFHIFMYLSDIKSNTNSIDILAFILH
jgi:hypothetical protein